jgi:signal transduction histidine kinase
MTRLSLLQKVAIATILPIVALGFVLQRALRNQVEERAFRTTVQSAELVAALGVQPQLHGVDLLVGPTETQVGDLDRAFAGGALGADLARIKVWNRYGQIVYSDNHDLIGVGANGNPSGALAGALRGTAVAEIVRPDDDLEESGGAAATSDLASLLEGHGALLEIYVPIFSSPGQPPIGVFEMYLPYAPTEAVVAGDVRRIQFVLFAGLAILYLALLPIIARASRQLERQAAIERDAADRLRQADEMKNTFLNAVSHELRTPLSAVLGCAVSLNHASEMRLSDADMADLGNRLESNARKLSRLLSDLLDLDRLSQGILQPRRAPTDVAEMVRHVVEDTHAADHRSVHVTAPPLVVDIDGAKVERILENLIVNSIRHSGGTQLWISAVPEAEGLLLVVEDDGPGIPLELREGIFEPFRRGSDAPIHAPGVGVGLSIVMNFAHLHGGRAWVEDRPGGGASFRVLIPGARSTALTPAG